MISSNPGCCTALGQRIDYHFAAGKDCFAQGSRFKGVIHLLVGALLYFPLTRLIIYVVSKIFCLEISKPPVISVFHSPSTTPDSPPISTPGEQLLQQEIDGAAWCIQLIEEVNRKSCEKVLRTRLDEGARSGYLNMRFIGPYGFGTGLTIAHWFAIRPEVKPYIDYLSILLEYDGVDLTILDPFGNTALLWAIANANNEKALLLIQRGKGDFLNVQDTHHRNTALHLAVGKGYTTRSVDRQRLTVSNLQLVQALIEKGANVNLKNREGNTPLHLAYARRDRAMIDALLKAGADPEVPNNAGQKPKDLWDLGYRNAEQLLKDTVGVFLLDKKQYAGS